MVSPAGSLSLRGKVAFVTGSGRENGIGAAIARALAQHGADVAIHYVSESSQARAEAVAANICGDFGVRATVVRGPVQDRGAAFRMVQEAMHGLESDHIDILVNNAGTASSTTLPEYTPEELAYDFGVNVFATVYLTQAVTGPGNMPRGGRIINISTIVSKHGPEMGAIYAASKAAQDSLTASWATVLGHSRGITVNTIAPGTVTTDASEAYLWNADGTRSEAQLRTIRETRAGERLGTTDDLADAVLLLASEKSRWITAQYISVSGGA